MDGNEKFGDSFYARPWIAWIGAGLALVWSGMFLFGAVMFWLEGNHAAALTCAAIPVGIVAAFAGGAYVARRRGGSMGEVAKFGLRCLAITVLAGLALAWIGEFLFVAAMFWLEGDYAAALTGAAIPLAIVAPFAWGFSATKRRGGSMDEAAKSGLRCLAFTAIAGLALHGIASFVAEALRAGP